MKYLGFALGSFLFSSLAVAQTVQEVQLDGQSAAAQADRVIVVRNHQTPRKVKLTLQIEFTYAVCVREVLTRVYGPHYSCGYETVYDGEPVMRSCDHEESTCVQTGSAKRIDQREVRLKFGKLGRLDVGEEERYEISGKQVRFDSLATFIDAKVLQSVDPTEAKSGAATRQLSAKHAVRLRPEITFKRLK
ncbi:MAG: hypothetical protein JNL01_13015 [Bdellovibrionales bacterium]|nr:hypothetical protein [Bdellovibrionales bacterium]